MKFCSICKKQKNFAEFYSSKTNKDGFRSYCKKCNNLKAREWQKQNQELLTLRQREYAAVNRDYYSKKFKEWSSKNPEYNKTRFKKRLYKETNRNKVRCANRRSSRLQRTPKWADLNSIKQIYNSCPPNMVVDHIVPLQGKTVSGLHVEYNLQYLTEKENLSKGNKYGN